MTRRDILRAAGIVPLAASSLTTLSPQMSHASPVGVVRSALHVHSSFSEGAARLNRWSQSSRFLASMESHADSLRRLGFDLCMFTDHDHRMAAETPGLTPRKFPSVEDLTKPAWTYAGEHLGSGSGSHRLGSRGLEVTTTGGGTQLAFADCAGKGWNYRATLSGTTLAVTVYTPRPHGTAELWVQGSHRPARNGRAQGAYSVRYVLSPSESLAGPRVAAVGNQAVVTVPVTANALNTVTLDPVSDLRTAFPDLGKLADDNGLYGIWFGISAASGSATATFTTLRLNRSTDLDGSIALQQELLPEVTARYPGLRLAQGLEQSYGLHLNWLATDGVVGLRPDGKTSMDAYLRSCVGLAHAAGGASSYNHMFGASIGLPLSGTERQAKIDHVAKVLLANSLYGAELLEVGYALRGGMDLAGHIEAWDVLLAAGLMVYADGATDNHAGHLQSYRGGINKFATDILAPSSDPAVAVPALRSGRCFVSSAGDFSGRIDLAHGAARMGGTAMVGGKTTDVVVTVEGLPPGVAVNVTHYAVHGDRKLYRRREPLKRFTITKLPTSTAVVTVAAVTSYLRVEVVNAARAVVAFSNPIFLRRI